VTIVRVIMHRFGLVGGVVAVGTISRLFGRGLLEISSAIFFFRDQYSFVYDDGIGVSDGPSSSTAVGDVAKMVDETCSDPLVVNGGANAEDATTSARNATHQGNHCRL
jgi:hypothetical protein